VADLKEAILARVNIAELIGQYVTLKQAGREFKGRCPFHDETAASFHVNPERHWSGWRASTTSRSLAPPVRPRPAAARSGSTSSTRRRSSCSASG